MLLSAREEVKKRERGVSKTIGISRKFRVTGTKMPKTGLAAEMIYLFKPFRVFFSDVKNFLCLRHKGKPFYFSKCEKLFHGI